MPKNHSLNRIHISYQITIAMTLAVALSQETHASSLFRNGSGARSMSLTGADVAVASDPLGAMYANPAGLSYLAQP